MDLTVVSFQKNRNRELEAVEAEYRKRLSRHARVNLHQIRKWDAHTKLDPALTRQALLVGMFAEGETFTSELLAHRLADCFLRGCSRLVLVIGGSEGMPSAAEGQIQERWSLSHLTFSHHLARLILLEVLYRSFDIIKGGRYHK